MPADVGLSQEDFAAAFGLSLGAIRNSDSGRRQPEGPARALLVIIKKAPMDALGVGRSWPSASPAPSASAQEDAVRDRGQRARQGHHLCA